MSVRNQDVRKQEEASSSRKDKIPYRIPDCRYVLLSIIRHLVSGINYLINYFNNIQWKEYSFNKLFDNIIQGRRLKKDDQIPGELPFVMSGTTNTGVVDYIGNDIRVFPKNSLTIDIFGNVFYRNYSYGMGDDTGAYWNDNNSISQKAMLYISTVIQKSLEGKFDYGNKLRSSQTANFKVKLPTTTQNEPDYAYMEHLISAVQKSILRRLSNYLD